MLVPGFELQNGAGFDSRFCFSVFGSCKVVSSLQNTNIFHPNIKEYNINGEFSSGFFDHPKILKCANNFKKQTKRRKCPNGFIFQIKVKGSEIGELDRIYIKTIQSQSDSSEQTVQVRSLIWFVIRSHKKCFFFVSRSKSEKNVDLFARMRKKIYEFQIYASSVMRQKHNIKLFGFCGNVCFTRFFSMLGTSFSEILWFLFLSLNCSNCI